VTRRNGQAFSKYEREAILATFDAIRNLKRTAETHHVSIGAVHKLVHGRKGGEDGLPAAKEPEKAATTQPAPAHSLLPTPTEALQPPVKLIHPTNPAPPTQSESKTRATSWELVGSLALASKAVLRLFHDELQNPLPDGRSLNEFASILQKLHISYGITVEKARLLHNESTGIISKVEDLSKLPEGVTLDVAIAFIRGTIHNSLPDTTEGEGIPPGKPAFVKGK
jgi:hypothetical protein